MSMTRRQVIVRAGLAAAWLGAGGAIAADRLGVFDPAPPFDRSEFPEPGQSAVAVLRAQSYDGDLERLLLDAMRIVKPDVRGRSVLLKPNLVEYASGSSINTDPRLVVAAANTLRRLGDDGRHDRLPRTPDRGEPHAERPEEELDRTSEPDREPGREADVPVAPRERDEQAEQRRQVRDAHLADHLRPQRERSVDAPDPHADDPERRQRARDAQEGDRPVGRREWQRRQRTDDHRHERRPDEVAAA